MNKQKLIMASIACFLFFQLIMAVKPKRDITTNLALNKLKELASYVNLTDSQKSVILKQAKDYELQYIESSKISNTTLKNTKILQADLKFKATIDSILTTGQRDTLRNNRVLYLRNEATKN